MMRGQINIKLFFDCCCVNILFLNGDCLPGWISFSRYHFWSAWSDSLISACREIFDVHPRCAEVVFILLKCAPTCIALTDFSRSSVTVRSNVFDVEYIYGFVWWGVCTQSRWRHSVTVPHTRWRICVTMATLWQQQDGGYMLLFYIFNSTVVDWTCLFFFKLVREIARSHYQLRRVCLSVCLHGTTRLPLDGFSWNLNIFWKSVEKIHVSLKCDKNDRHFTWRPTYIFLSHLAQVHLEWEIFQTKVVEKIKTHIIKYVLLMTIKIYKYRKKNTTDLLYSTTPGLHVSTP